MCIFKCEGRNGDEIDSDAPCQTHWQRRKAPDEFSMPQIGSHQNFEEPQREQPSLSPHPMSSMSTLARLRPSVRRIVSISYSSIHKPIANNKSRSPSSFGQFRRQRTRLSWQRSPRTTRSPSPSSFMRSPSAPTTATCPRSTWR